MKKIGKIFKKNKLSSLIFLLILTVFAFAAPMAMTKSKYIQDKPLEDDIELALINFRIPDNISVKDILESGPYFQQHIMERFEMKPAYADKEGHTDWNTDSGATSKAGWIDYGYWEKRQHPNVEKIIFADASEYQAIFDKDKEKIDVSATRSKTIYLCKSPAAPTTAYVLRVGVNEYPRIYANPDCSQMFENLIHLKTIDFGETTVAQNTTANTAANSPRKAKVRSAATADKWEIDQETLGKEPFFSTVLTRRMDRMFYYCVRLTNVGYFNNAENPAQKEEFIPENGQNGSVFKFNTKQVERMERMFTACRSLKSMDITSFETHKVQNMREMFSDCLILMKLDLNMGTFDTSQVMSMKSMFHRSYSITSLDGVINKFNTANVLDMEEMFSDCYALQSLDLSNFDTGKVGSQEYTDIDGKTVYGHMGGMFAECASLTALKLQPPAGDKGFDTLNVRTMASMFRNCKVLTTVEWTPGTGSSLMDLTKFNTGNVEDMNLMFGGCNAVQNIQFSGTFNTSKVTDMSLMFADCFELQSLDLSGFNTASVTNMAEMFRTCRSIRTLDVSKFNTEKVTNMSSMFANCSLLTDIKLPVAHTAEGVILDSMFASCSSLKKLDLSEFNPAQAKSMDKFLAYCWNLETLKISLDKFILPNDAPLRTLVEPCENFKFVQLGELKISNRDAPFSRQTSLSAGEDPFLWTKEALAKRFAGVGLEFSKLTTTTPLKGSNSISLNTVFSEFTKLNTDQFTALKVIKFQELTITKSPDMSQMFDGFRPEGIEIDLLQLPEGSNITVQDLFRNYTGKLYSVRQCKGGYAQNGLGELDFILGNKLPMSELDLTGVDLSRIEDKAAGKSFGELFTTDTHQNLTTVKLGKVSVHPLAPNADKYIFDGLNTGNSPVRNVEIQELDLTGAPGIPLERLFPKLESLKIDKVIIDKNDPNKNTNMSGLFKGIKAAKLDLSGMDTSEVTNMKSMFADTSDLTTLDISRFNTAKVTNMASMFANASGLKQLNINSFDTQKVTTMAHMFEGMSSLEFLDFSGATNFKTDNVTNMSYMFADSSKLWSLDFTNFRTSKVTDMSFMFKGCSHLATTTINGNPEMVLNLSGFETSQVTNMASMFQDCISLKNIKFGSSFQTHNVTNMASMFANTQLWQLNLNDFNTSNVENMAQMFQGATTLSTLLVERWDTSKVKDMSFMFADCWSLGSLDLSSFQTSSVTNMASMFAEGWSLKTLQLGSGFQTPNVTDMSFMFSNCERLQNLDLSGFNTRNVTSMAGMFERCEELLTVNLSGFQTSNLENISRMFERCLKLQAIYSDHDWTFVKDIDDTDLFGAYRTVIDGTGNPKEEDTHCNNLKGGSDTGMFYILYWTGNAKNPSDRPSDPSSIIRYRDLLRVDQGAWSGRPGVFTKPAAPQSASSVLESTEMESSEIPVSEVPSSLAVSEEESIQP